MLIDLGVVVFTALIGLTCLILGYLVGWHRGALRLPLWRQPKRPKPTTAPSGDSAPPPETEAERLDRRKRITLDVERAYPHLRGEHLNAAVDEIVTKGAELRRGVGR
jgi:hypothetical protein